MIEENKYCSDVTKRRFNKELVMTKKDAEHFENSSKCLICDNTYYVDDDVKVGDYCHVIGKYRGSAHRDCNIKVKLNYKNFLVFHSLKK